MIDEMRLIETEAGDDRHINWMRADAIHERVMIMSVRIYKERE